MLSFTNLTPHEINVVSEDNGETILTLPSEGLARCVSSDQTVAEFDLGNDITIPIVKKTFGDVTGLGEKKADHYYVVSRIVAEALPERRDLLISGNPVRDEDGRIVGCTCFCEL